MKRVTALIMATAATLAISAPAFAGPHFHRCGCGHVTCSTSSGGGSWGGTKPPRAPSGGSTTSGGTTTSSGGSTSGGSTSIPEPGMIAMMGLGLMGVGLARRRKRRA